MTDPAAQARERSAASWPDASAGTCSTAARSTGWWRSLAAARAWRRTTGQGTARIARTLQCQFAAGPDGSELILLGGLDVTAEVRTEESGAGASRVAAWGEVRQALLDRQRAYASAPGLVADGRDMGTVVFPTAPLKIFLVASAEERARRRYNQLKGKDSGVSLAALSREIAARDRQDSSRAVSPLVPAEDAVIVDSTSLSATEVVDLVWRLGRERELWRTERA